MKLLLTTLAISILGVLSQAQTASYDQVGNKEVKGSINEYITESAAHIKVGDTLKIGYPFRNQTFTHISSTSNNVLSDFDLTELTPLTSTVSGHIVVIKKMKASKRKVYVKTKGAGESKAVTIINFEEAINTGEIVIPGYLTSEVALELLKKEKDKFELGLITEKEYKKKVAELKSYII